MGDVAEAALLLLLGGAVVLLAARKLQVGTGRAAKLYLWHTAWCFVYWWTESSQSADASAYFRNGLSGAYELGVGTRFINFVASVLARDLSLSLLGAFLVFNVLGAIGLLVLAQTIREVTAGLKARPRRLWAAALWLPSLSFWTSALGKDAPAFLGAAVATYASLNIGGRWLLLMAGTIVMFSVRPHVAAIVLGSAIVGVAASRQVPTGKRVGLFVAASMSAALLVPVALRYVGLGDSVSLLEASTLIETRQAYNVSGGSSVDIAAMSFPVQMITYMFRPLFIDARGVYGYAASIENLLLLLVLIAALVRTRPATLAMRSYTLTFNLAFLVVGWTVLASVTANLGIAVRQKTMLMPALLVAAAMLLRRDGSRRTLRRHDRPLRGLQAPVRTLEMASGGGSKKDRGLK